VIIGIHRWPNSSFPSISRPPIVFLSIKDIRGHHISLSPAKLKERLGMKMLSKVSRTMAERAKLFVPARLNFHPH
jgi:hypothetical protein